MKFKFSNLVGQIFILTLFILLFIFPDLSKTGIKNGLLLCGNVLIPSLFPISVCVIFIINSNFFEIFNILSPLTKKLLGLDGASFAIMLISFIGGYPIGAKLINNAVRADKLSPSNARRLLGFCVNAGPAFIITAVGRIIFNSASVGLVLFFSHIISSLLICIFSNFNNKEPISYKSKTETTLNIADNFVISVSESCEAMLNICKFVLFFSIITVYTNHFSRLLSLLFEITNAVTLTKNVYLLSFLLGFGGICLWFQIFSLCKAFKINIFHFALTRFSHGFLSCLITFLIIRIFKISLPTLSFGNNFAAKYIYSTPLLTICLALTIIVFIFSISKEKYNCKIIEDVV